MIRTIRPLDRPDPRLERVAKANGFSLHAGVSCEGNQKDKRERLCRYISRPAVASPPPFAEFHRQGGLHPEDTVPGWDDPGGLRTGGFHCAIGGPGTEAEGQPHPLPRRTRAEPPLAWAGHTSQARERHQVYLQRRSPHTRRASCRNDLGSAAKACFQHRHRGHPLWRFAQFTLSRCSLCGGSVRVIACIEDQDVIDRILTHLRQKEQETPTRPLLVPPTRAPPGTLPLFAGMSCCVLSFRNERI
jgi:hypothetical protein